jgi:hypothetical protein
MAFDEIGEVTEGIDRRQQFGFDLVLTNVTWQIQARLDDTFEPCSSA